MPPHRGLEKLRGHCVHHISVFGPTALDEATAQSDVDLLVATPAALLYEMRPGIVAGAIRAL